MLLYADCILRVRSGNLDVFEELLSATDPTQEAVPFADLIYIIVPQGCGSELVACADALAEDVADKTGIETEVRYDDEELIYGEDVFRILLGDTDLGVSDILVGKLKRDDYICRYERGSILIGGKADSATVAAVERFTDEILPTSSYASIMHEDAGFEYIGEYDVSSIRINGFDLYDFCIVYPQENSNCERDIADFVKSCLESNSGYMIDMMSDGEYDGSGKVIAIGACDGFDDMSLNGNASIVEIDQSILLCGKDSYSLSVAALEFAKRISECDSSGNIEVDIDTRMDIISDNEDLSLSAAFTDIDGESELRYIERLCGDIRERMPAMLAYGPINKKTAEHIKSNFASFYEMLIFDVNGDIAIPFFYDPDLLESVEVNHEGGIADVLLRTANGQRLRVVICFVGDGDSEALNKANEAFTSTGEPCVAMLYTLGQAISIDGEAIDGCSWLFNESVYSLSVFSNGGVNVSNAESAVQKYNVSAKDCVNVFCDISFSFKYAEGFDT